MSKEETTVTTGGSAGPGLSPAGALVSLPSQPVIEARAGALTVEPPAPRRRRRLWPLALAAIALAIAAGLGAWHLLPPTVEVATPLRGPAVEAVYSTGTVEAPVLISIAPRAAGRIAEVAVDENAVVAKGDVLVRLEDEGALESVRQYSALEVFARQQFERVAKLLEKGAVAQSTFDRAQSDWQSAQAATARAEAQARELRLTAPSNGRIVKRDGEVGQYVAPGQAILWLTTDEPLRVTGAIDEEDIARVSEGLPVLIRADAFPGETFHGKVQSITPMGDAVARSYRVRIALGETTPLRIGMTAEINIVTRENPDALLVPTRAIDKDRVWRVVDGKLVATPVTLGVRGVERTEIVAGLSPGDTIVVAPAADLREGERVRVRQAAPG